MCELRCGHFRAASINVDSRSGIQWVAWPSSLMSSIDAAALAPVHRRVWQNNRPRRPPPMTSSTGNRSDGHGLCHGLDSAPAPRMSARHKVMLQLAHELPVAELVEQSSSSARTETPVAVFSSLILATSPHSSPHTRGNAGCSQLCVRSTELELRRSHPVQKVQHAFLHRSVQIHQPLSHRSTVHSL